MVRSVSLPPRNPFFRRLLVMKRTPVVMAFFVASILVGAYLLYSTPATESFEIAKELGEPVPQSDVMPSYGAEAGPLNLKEAPYDITEDAKLYGFDDNRVSSECCPSPFVSDLGCICLTDAQKALYASRGGNGNV